MQSAARILVVDDEPAVRDSLRQLLEAAGYLVEMASNGREAVGKVAAHPPDLVLLDVIMPGMNGLEACRLIKARRDLGFVPVIIVTAHADVESRIEALRIGADDYVFKPADQRELLARIEALLRIKSLQDRMSTSLKESEDQSLLDAETGLYNRRFLDRRVRDEFKRAERYQEPLSCILLEVRAATIPHRRLAELMCGAMREFDTVTRSDTNRYTILLPRTHFTGALTVANRIWKSLMTELEPAGNAQVTMGVSFFPHRDVHNSSDMLAQAQQALDWALQAGGRQICLLQHTTYYCRPDMD